MFFLRLAWFLFYFGFLFAIRSSQSTVAPHILYSRFTSWYNLLVSQASPSISVSYQFPFREFFITSIRFWLTRSQSTSCNNDPHIVFFYPGKIVVSLLPHQVFVCVRHNGSCTWIAFINSSNLLFISIKSLSQSSFSNSDASKSTRSPMSIVNPIFGIHHSFYL